MNKEKRGVIHLLLVFVVLVLVAFGFVVLTLVKPNLKDIYKPTSNQSVTSTPAVTSIPTITTTQISSLEEEVNYDQLTDPAGDFDQVDKDIESL